MQLASGVTLLEYTTSVPLTPGVHYTFKVSARNQVGEGALSDPISIYAATYPDAPVTLTEDHVITNAYQIGINWQDGAYDGGSPVLDYEVWYKETEVSEYTMW